MLKHVNYLCNFNVALVLLLSGAIYGCAQPPDKKHSENNNQTKVMELPIPTEYKDSVEKEFALGSALKTYDDVAWLGTDAVIALGFKLQSYDEASYIVEPMSNDVNGTYQFAFIANFGGNLGVVAIADIKHDSGMGHVIGAKLVDPPITPSDQDIWLYQALHTASKAPGLQLCNAIYNHVVMPYYENGKLEYRVYFLMSTNKKGEIPIGGHVLVRVADDAHTILEVKLLSKSCMMANESDAKNVTAIMLSDLALNSPSAVQVFLMYRYQTPVYVKTENNFLWAIDSRGIRLLSDGKIP